MFDCILHHKVCNKAGNNDDDEVIFISMKLTLFNKNSFKWSSLLKQVFLNCKQNHASFLKPCPHIKEYIEKNRSTEIITTKNTLEVQKK